MFGNKEIKRLQGKIDELSEDIKIILERQNKQYTDIMLFLKSNAESNITTIDNRTMDELYEQIIKTIKKSGMVSASYIQRKFKVGYARAAQLMDKLEDNGVIGPGKGYRPRKILIKTKKHLNK